MAKKIIRLTESDLHKIVKGAVKKVLREDTGLGAVAKEIDFSNKDDRDAWDSIRRNVNNKRDIVYNIIDGIYDGEFDNDIANGTIWKKIENIIPDIDSFMYDRLRNELSSAISDQRAIADKNYAFKYGKEDHYGDDDYYEDEYGDWRNKFEDSVVNDLTYGDSYDWDTSNDPYDSKQLGALRNKNVLDNKGHYAKYGKDADKAWDEHDKIRRGQIDPEFYNKKGERRKYSSTERILSPRSHKRGAFKAAGKQPLHRKGSLNRAFD